MYRSLYRRWRPQTFREVVGQEHITTTLRNAVRLKRIAHAYLFAGPRGTGKTSTARILAKAVNCRQVMEGEPCNQCTDCYRISEGISLDVVEIDAASNRGIDEIRDLREKVHFLPADGPYRVYIVDEVHMLTQEAFNALLKTLEEPPPHIIFILATTEPYHLPPTVVSRCVRFDFRHLPFSTIKGALGQIASSEGLVLEEQAAHRLAVLSGGSMRDALGLLEQCYNFDPHAITVSSVEKVTGAVNVLALRELAYNLCKRNAIGALEIVDKALSEGKEPGQLAVDLARYLRDMLLVKLWAGGTPELLSGEDPEELARLAGLVTERELTRLIDGLMKLEGDLRWSPEPRLFLETCLLEGCREGGGELVLRLEELEARVARLEAGERGSIRANQDAPRLPERKQELSVQAAERFWPQVLERVKRKKKLLHAILVEARVVGVEGDKLIIAFPTGYTYHRDQIEKPEQRCFVEEVVKEVTGLNLAVECVGLDREEKVREDPVSLAVKLFDGKVV